MLYRALPRLGCVWLVILSAVAASSPLDAPLKTIRAVGPEGQGNAAARPSWEVVSKAPVGQIIVVLTAMDGANDYALNWMRAAVESQVQRANASGQKLPVAELEVFLRNPQHHPRARRFAYELIAQAQPETARQILPTLVNDPSNELRRDAVQLLVDAAAAKTATDRSSAVAEYQKALAVARDPDQVEDIAKQLKGLSSPVDLQKIFGWVTRWKLIGPFDNTDGKGFEAVFPPEQQIDFAAEYMGKTNRVRWQDYETKNEYGLVDFNAPFTPMKGVTGYAFAEFWSDTDRAAEIRIGVENGWKVWANGKFLFGRDEYHQGAEIDQYRMPVELRKGRNTILVKCCQNEEVQDWTKEWEFQLRLTDAQGTPIVSTK